MDHPESPRVERWPLGPTHRLVTIWSMRAWNALNHAERPPDAHYIGGIGWVVVGPEVPPDGAAAGPTKKF